jgi:hypothetical protein
MKGVTCAALILLSLCLGACGAEDATTSGPEVLRGTGAKTAPLKVSGGSSAQFRVKGGDNSIQEYGIEADAVDLEAAAKVLHRYLVARAERKWGLACTYLTPRQVDQLIQLAASSPQLDGKGCGSVLAALLGGVSGSAARDLTVIDAVSLRSQGGQSYLLYRGAGDTGYFAPMIKQGAIWRVASLEPTAFP